MNQDPSFTGVKKASYSPSPTTTPRMNGGATPNMLNYNRADNTALPQSQSSPRDPAVSTNEGRNWCTRKTKIIVGVFLVAIVVLLVVVLPSTLVKSQSNQENEALPLQPSVPKFVSLRGNITAVIRRPSESQKDGSQTSDRSFLEFLRSKLRSTESPFKPTPTTTTASTASPVDIQGSQNATETKAPAAGQTGSRRKRQASPVAMANFIHMLNESGLLQLATNLGLVKVNDTEAADSSPSPSTTVIVSPDGSQTTPARSQHTSESSGPFTSESITTSSPSTPAIVLNSQFPVSTEASTITPEPATTSSTFRLLLASQRAPASAIFSSATTVSTAATDSTPTASAFATATSKAQSTLLAEESTTIAVGTSQASLASSTETSTAAGGGMGRSAVSAGAAGQRSSTNDSLAVNASAQAVSSEAGNTTTVLTVSLATIAPPLFADDSNFTDEQVVIMERLGQMIMEASRDTQLCAVAMCKAVEVDDLSLDDRGEVTVGFRILMDDDVTNLELHEAARQQVQAAIEHSVRQQFAALYSPYQLDNLAMGFDFYQFCQLSHADCNLTFPEASLTNLTGAANASASAFFGEDEFINGTAFNGTNSHNNSTDRHGDSMTTEAPASTTQYLPIFPNPPPVANCSEYGFLCSNMKQRVATRQRCDGELNCVDGSDEEFCRDCLTAFKCPVNDDVSKCLRGQQLCDGVRDCPTGFDESDQFCRSHCIPGQQYKCRGANVCIPLSFLCDGDKHCPNGDDESHCSSKTGCNNNAMFCVADNTCIPQWKRCDGVSDCSDGSDENDCSCVECSGDNAVLCHADKGRCIQRSMLCNNQFDCPGHEDEINCPGWCDPKPPVETVVCADGKLYPRRYACAGYIDVCSGSCDRCDPEIGFRCTVDKTCIKRELVCDGIPNCSDGSDERPKLCACFGPNNYTCKDERNHCISPDKICDGFRDCLGGDDELNCASCENNPVGFHCSVRQRCFTSNHRCDGVVDCPDYSDEDNCTCTDCKSHYGYSTFMCKNNQRCLHQSYVCNPKSAFNCPASQGQEPEDEIFCPNLFVVGKQLH